MKRKADEVFVTKRKLETLQYDLATMIRSEAISDWPVKVARVYDKHFEEKVGKNDKIKSPER
jgi:hypothetical protein